MSSIWLHAEAQRLQQITQKRRGEELPLSQGQEQWLSAPGCEGAGVAKRSYPTCEVRGGGREKQPHVQEAVAAWVQEGREELLHVQS